MIAAILNRSTLTISEITLDIHPAGLFSGFLQKGKSKENKNQKIALDVA